MSITVKKVILKNATDGSSDNQFANINSFIWRDEVGGLEGSTSRDRFFDWIKEDKGVAYFEKKDGTKYLIEAKFDPNGTKRFEKKLVK